jgi:phosphoglycolate phosphatase
MRFKDKKKLLIFDLDGTLIDSAPDLALAINSMMEDLNFDPIPLDVIKGFIGNGAKTLVSRSLSYRHQHRVSRELYDRAFQKFMEAYKSNPCEKTKLYPGVKETLKYLKGEGYQMVICTNKPEGFLAPILEGLDIDRYFDNWIGETSLNEKKPSGLPLLYLAKEALAPIDSCLMIGDSRNDVLAASNANMESIGLSYGYNYGEGLKKYNPTVIINKFINLKKIL